MFRVDRCSRDALIDWLHSEVPYKYLRRAIEDERVEVLGLFKSIPPLFTPAVLVRVTTRHGTDTILTLRHTPQRTTMQIIQDVPWAKYVGGSMEVLMGDRPMRYIEKREEYIRDDYIRLESKE
jgi:hypothetical protein